jgi:dGTPase
VSVPDVLWWLDEASKDETLTDEQRKVLITVQRSAQHDYTYYRNQDLSPEELNDLAIQKFRVYAIGAMVYAIVDEFKNKIDCIISGTYKTDLLTCSSAGALCKGLKKFARRHAYVHRSVREVELEGHNVIRELMSIFWEAIAAKRKCVDDPFHSYVYSRISENYRRVAKDPYHSLPSRYIDCQLLTDMISGMTDSFAVDLCRHFKMYRHHESRE